MFSLHVSQRRTINRIAAKYGADRFLFLVHALAAINGACMALPARRECTVCSGSRISLGSWRIPNVFIIIYLISKVSNHPPHNISSRPHAQSCSHFLARWSLKRHSSPCREAQTVDSHDWLASESSASRFKFSWTPRSFAP